MCVFQQALDYVSSTGRPLESASDHLTEMAMKERYLFITVTGLLHTLCENISLLLSMTTAIKSNKTLMAFYFCYSIALEPITVETKDTRSNVKWHKKYQRLYSGGSGENIKTKYHKC